MIIRILLMRFCGGYERIKGNMTGDKKKGTFYVVKERNFSRGERVFSSEPFWSAWTFSDREKIRSNAKRVEEEKVWDSVKGIDIHCNLSSSSMEIECGYSSSTSDSDISNHLYKKYAISHAENVPSKSEFRKWWKLKSTCSNKIWDNQHVIVNYSETVYKLNFRDFVTMRPYELDSYVQTIRRLFCRVWTKKIRSSLRWKKYSNTMQTMIRRWHED